MKSLHSEAAVDKPTVGFAPLMKLQPTQSQRLEAQEACYREVGSFGARRDSFGLQDAEEEVEGRRVLTSPPWRTTWRAASAISVQ